MSLKAGHRYLIRAKEVRLASDLQSANVFNNKLTVKNLFALLLLCQEVEERS